MSLNTCAADQQLRNLICSTEQNPQDSKAWLDLGNYYYNRRSSIEAICAFRKAYDLDLKSFIVANDLGDCHFDLGLFEDALIWYRKAVSIKPRFPEAWLNLGNVLMELGRWEAAEQALEKACDLNPDADEAFLYRGLCLLRLNRPVEAKELLEKSIELEAGEFQSYISLCDCFLRLGDLPGAIAACKKAMPFSRNLGEMEFLLESMLLAGVTPVEAESHRQQAQAIAGKSVDLRALPAPKGRKTPLLPGFSVMAKAVLEKHFKPAGWEVLVRRFGLEGKEPMSLQTVASGFNKTREWARQVEGEALRRVNAFLVSKQNRDPSLPEKWMSILDTFFDSVQSHGPLVPLTEILNLIEAISGKMPTPQDNSMLEFLGELKGWEFDPPLPWNRQPDPETIICVDSRFDLKTWLIIEREIIETLERSIRGMDEISLIDHMKQRLQKRFDEGLVKLGLRFGRRLEQRPDGKWQVIFQALNSRADKVYRLLFEAGHPMSLSELVTEVTHRESVGGGKSRVTKRSLSSQLTIDPRFQAAGSSGNWALTEWEGISDLNNIRT
ncbi:MAG: tetratricopeptide repeat protein [Candidatus Riflebacteria bacterium]|nr:tetratricopeptide repeat protein [Candidatus Riflebacteria bacterium]